MNTAVSRRVSSAFLRRSAPAAPRPKWRQRSAILMHFEDNSRLLGVKLGVLVLLATLLMARLGLL